MSGLLNKAKEMLHGDKSHGAHDTHGTQQDTYGTTGSHESRLGDKLDPRVDADAGTYSNQGSTTGFRGGDTDGPHRSDLANKADPRVDSDRDRSHGAYGDNTGYSGTGGYGTHDTSGPHRSDLANKADPRVDSDKDGSYGAYGSTTGTTGYGSHDTAGPHRSDLANKADPRVDSDRDGSRGAFGSSGYGDTSSRDATGFGGTGNSSHVTRTAELLDPHVSGHRSGDTGVYMETDRDDTRNVSGTGHGTSTSRTGYGDNTGYGDDSYGSGRAPNTSGPHSSDLGNKMDPRVDSDRDGSRTYGGNQTYSQRDSLDARQHPPSVMKEHLGHPTDEQGQMSDYGRRHSTKPIEDIRNYGGGHQ